MSRLYPRALAGFTLLEMSVVVMVLSLLTATALGYAATRAETNNTAKLNTTLDVIEQALQNYRVAYGRLPCPSDITLAENSAGFGTEVGTPGDGSCTGYNVINSSTDPDAAGGSDANFGGAADSLYDATTASTVVGGAVPTKALQLADKYAYDVWGRKIFYAVDKRATATNAFVTYSTYSKLVGAIVIKNIGSTNNAGSCAANTANAASGSCLSRAVNIRALYALVSYGKNGHGGYVRNPSTTSTVFNAGSTNTDEQKNCHCDSSAVATNFDRIFVQKYKTNNSATVTDAFDDIVRFKTRGQMATSTELQ